jgi:hypothetical protein
VTTGLVQVDAGSRWLRLAEPSRIIVATRPGDVVPALQAVQEDARSHGRFALGVIR